MLGNDVVDLQDVDARPETFHRRFDARVFAPEERRRIAADPRPQALRWAHWAAKEAAYKLMRQRDPGFVFSPIRLVACFDEPGTGRLPGSTGSGRLEVAGQEGTSPHALELTCFETSDYVHVLALPADGDWQAVSTAVGTLADRSVDPSAASEGASPDDPSTAVRRLALREIARVLELAPSRLAIGRRGRIPVLELDGRATPISLSLSHHGRFVAYAMVRPLHGLRVVRAGRAGTGGGARDAGTDRNETDDVDVAQAVGAVGRPGRRADAQRKTG